MDDLIGESKPKCNQISHNICVNEYKSCDLMRKIFEWAHDSKGLIEIER